MRACAHRLLGSGAHGVVRIAQHVQTLECARASHTRSSRMPPPSAPLKSYECVLLTRVRSLSCLIADVAVKITPTSVVRSACKEVTALTRLNHAHIVQLLGVQVDMAEERVYMVMELCHGGELFDRIAECGGLAEEEAKRYFVQILHALSHCHENRVYHRDLKPENILLDADDNAKVADFGLAAVYRHVAGGASYLQHTKVGSVMYAAPEVLVSTAVQGYDAACADIWSLGVILFSMLSGTLPFTCAAASKCKRYAAVLRHGIGVMCPEHLSPQVTMLLSRLLHPDPAQRITPEEALNSDWVRGEGATWPREHIGRNRRAGDEPGGRSWTITMRVPAEHLRALPSVIASGAAATAGSVPQQGGAGAVEQQQQQQQQQQEQRQGSSGSGSATAAAAASAAIGASSSSAAAPPFMGASRLGAACSYSASALADVDMGAASPGKRKRDELEEAAAAAAASADAASASASAGEESAAAGGGVVGVARSPHGSRMWPRPSPVWPPAAKTAVRARTSDRAPRAEAARRPPSASPTRRVSHREARCRRAARRVRACPRRRPRRRRRLLAAPLPRRT